MSEFYGDDNKVGSPLLPMIRTASLTKSANYFGYRIPCMVILSIV